MKTNNFVSRFIVVTLTAALLLMSGSRAIPVSALAVGPLADPVYDTEIIAFKDYVEANLDAPQLDIMFFLIGGLAVAQMGAQDAMLISPYPNEENVKEWIINCGIQLYNSVIGLVPEGDYYMGIPSIGTDGQKGVPRQVIKALVAQMMGDAVVAINYPDLDTFLEENPDKLLLPFNADLQLGVNAVLGLNGGLYNWQNTKRSPKNLIPIPSWEIYNQSSANSSFTYLSSYIDDYHNYVRCNPLNGITTVKNFAIIANKYYLFYNTATHYGYVYDSEGRQAQFTPAHYAYTLNSSGDFYVEPSSPSSNSSYWFNFQSGYNFSFTYTGLLDSIYDDLQNRQYGSSSYGVRCFMHDLVDAVYYGTSWENRILLPDYEDGLGFAPNDMTYFQQVTNDYLFDLRGLMGDLVNYVYLNPIWDNIYDLVGNLVVPDRVKVSVDLTPITDLLAPPVPVNMNDIAEYTDNTYLERVKEHARNAGDIFANYVAFWHNCDSDLVYTVFGAAILVLVGAFVGKWGHS